MEIFRYSDTVLRWYAHIHCNQFAFVKWVAREIFRYTDTVLKVICSHRLESIRLSFLLAREILRYSDTLLKDDAYIHCNQFVCLMGCQGDIQILRYFDKRYAHIDWKHLVCKMGSTGDIKIHGYCVKVICSNYTGNNSAVLWATREIYRCTDTVLRWYAHIHWKPVGL